MTPQTTSRPAAPARPAGPLRRAVQRHFYRWHRWLGILTLLPVIAWTLSGLMHPLMSNWLRPRIARETLPAQAVPRPTLPLRQLLHQHHLTTLRAVQLVRWQGEPAYQLLLDGPTAEPRYFSARTGAALGPLADRRFAEQLARYFTQDSVSPVLTAERLTHFTPDYPEVNRLLPVWKITFAAPNNLTVYVETQPARLAAFNNPTRTRLMYAFRLLHSWAWLELLGGPDSLRVGVMLTLLAVVLASTLSGLVVYGLLWRRLGAPRTTDRTGRLRRSHRVVGLAVALVTCTFGFSGGWHALRKLHPDERLRYHHAPAVPAARLTTDLTQLPLAWERVQQVGLVAFGGQVYYQVTQLPADAAPAPTSTGQPVEAVRATPITYYHAGTGQLLPDGSTRYGRFLADSFFGPAGQPRPAVTATRLLDHFEGEYGFINKRLPVLQVTYATPTHTALYVEPATGRLAARVDDADRYEGLSFAFLHKYHGLGSLGKNLRDAVTMLAAAGVLAVSLLGLALLLRRPVG